MITAYHCQDAPSKAHQYSASSRPPPQYFLSAVAVTRSSRGSRAKISQDLRHPSLGLSASPHIANLITTVGFLIVFMTKSIRAKCSACRSVMELISVVTPFFFNFAEMSDCHFCCPSYPVLPHPYLKHQSEHVRTWHNSQATEHNQ